MSIQDSSKEKAGFSQYLPTKRKTLLRIVRKRHAPSDCMEWKGILVVFQEGKTKSLRRRPCSGRDCGFLDI